MLIHHLHLIRPFLQSPNFKFSLLTQFPFYNLPNIVPVKSQPQLTVSSPIFQTNQSFHYFQFTSPQANSFPLYNDAFNYEPHLLSNKVSPFSTFLFVTVWHLVYSLLIIIIILCKLEPRTTSIIYLQNLAISLFIH